jgi:hypothetical protein
MNLQQYKFVVATGCSYGTTLSSLDCKFLNVDLETDNKIIFLEVSCASQGSDWAYDSMIYTIKKLLEFGVKTENIYCFVEWTQIERVTLSQPTILNDFFNTNRNPDRIFHITSNEPNENIKNFLYENLNIKGLSGFHNIKSIENVWYLTPSHIDKNDVLKFKNIDFEFMFEQMLEYEIRVPMELRVKKYLDNILNLQTYLKQVGIPYNFVSMQSQFSAWDMDLDCNLRHKYIFKENKPAIHYGNEIHINSKFKSNMNISNLNDLEHLLPQFKDLIHQIDFSNWWFHKSDFFRFGGIDEYAIEEYGLYGFLTTEYDIRFDTDINLQEITPSFGYHPNAFIHILLMNDMMFNNSFFKVSDKSIENIKSMVDEDINSKNITKHNLAISKIGLDKYISVI